MTACKKCGGWVGVAGHAAAAAGAEPTEHCTCTPPEAGAARCPSCGAWAPAAARQCSFCHVELASVRCSRCFALHYAGATVCSACGLTLGLEGTLGPVSGSCPRCRDATLTRVQVGEHEVTECTRCTGVFVDHTTLDRITKASDAQRSARMRPVASASAAPLPRQPVTYLPCPACGVVMNRKNFGEISGIILDVCKAHGVWFDAEELERALQFILAGGLDTARERATERDKAARALDAIRVRRSPGYYETAGSGGAGGSVIDAILDGLLK